MLHSGFPRLRSVPAWVLAAVLVLLSAGSLAVDRLGSRFGTLSGPGWQASGVASSLDLRKDGRVDLRLEIGALSLAEPPARVGPLRLSCPGARVDAGAVRCEGGRLSLAGAGLDRPELGVDVVWQSAPRRLHLKLRGLHLAGGEADLSLAWSETGWRAELDTREVGLAALKSLLQRYVTGIDQALAGYAGDGRTTLSLRASGTADGLSQADWDLSVGQLEFSDPAGEVAGAGIVGTARGQAHREGGDWQVKLEAGLDAGELLLSPLYLAPGGKPMRLTSELTWQAASGVLDVASLSYSQASVLDLEARARLELGDTPSVQQAQVHTGPVALPAFYAGYLKPVLAETLFDDLELAGTAQLDLDYAGAETARAELRLSDVHLDDRQRRFGLSGLDGDVTWAAQGPVDASQLAWKGGYLLESLSLGPTRLALRLVGDALALLEPAELPLLDGKLLVDRLAVADLGAAEPSLDFNGVLTPISMQAFSQAVGWPTLSGQFSGIIPELSYRQGVLQVGGTLLMRVFDGDVRIKGLRLDHPLGVFPTLAADVEFSDLDLETLTRTFAFGRITGRLEGYVHGLYLEDWRPVAFDARLQTPQGDDSRHRISQKAVDNLSNLGGAGISGALSRSFLRYFDEFGYQRLGIGCRLHAGVCEMDGVGPAKTGYTIVKGGGLPRIDVVGFNRRIDWDLLLRKLVEITESQGPVIE